MLDQNVPKDKTLSFQFRVKFFPEDMGEELVQELTQHLFYLQVKAAIVTEEVYCSPEAAVLLASYAIQAEVIRSEGGREGEGWVVFKVWIVVEFPFKVVEVC